ncbi:MAG TPA: flagellar hook-associated protein FlgK [Rhizomicrobium sp.]|nr:flagellar hook-associated protein FlgK [Rhizomicrobium sp.]
MALNGILSSALSALQTNTAALRVVSNNVANINTVGYDRRVVNEQASVVGGQLSGVSVGDVQRVSDQFLNQEALSANSASSQYAAQSDIFDQLNGMLGQPGDGSALTSQLSDVFSALASASLSPTASASQQGAMTAFQNLASSISTLSSSISGLQTQTDQQVSSSIGTVNSLIQQIYTLNQQATTAQGAGDDASGVLDQRDQAVQSLSQYMDVKTSTDSTGNMTVMTGDGVSLVSGTSYGQLSYAGGNASGSYGTIQLSNVDPQTGQTIGTATALDPHLNGGSLLGLIQMRDGTLGGLQQELGSFAQQTALAFNAQHNANSAVPPPTTMAGRDTGLTSTDALNFTGKTTVAISDSSGNLVSRVDVDFGAGTLSVDGGASVSIGSTVGSFASALNSALGSNGTASFTNGALTVSANGTNGVVVQDDATTPSSRGGAGFSQFFGLNDLFTSAAPSVLATGLSASDAGNFAAGGQMSFALKGTDGSVLKQATVTVAATDTIGAIVGKLNTAFSGSATFALGSNGAIAMTPVKSGAQLNVTNDTTSRGNTGMSFTSLFGIGVQQAGAQAAGFSVNAALTPSTLAFAQSDIDSTTVAGDSILGSGDSRGLLALQDIGTTQQSFAAAGGIAAQTSSLSDYAGSLYQDVATRSDAATTAATTQSDRLTEAQARQASTSGVNLDEELSNMMIYQQAYSAGARMLTVAQQLYDTLLQTV